MGKTRWDEKNIKKGFDRFFKEYGRLPTAPEIDKLSYLPSSRQIQRKHNGLVELRRKLGYSETNFGVGVFRSIIGKKSNKVGLDAEKKVEIYLTNIFGEPFVHTEKRVGNFKERVDFFVYNKTKLFAVEVLSPGSFRDLQKNINLKINRYLGFSYLLIFLVANEKYSQKRINDWIANKRKKLPSNSEVQNMQVFSEWIKRFTPFDNPMDT